MRYFKRKPARSRHVLKRVQSFFFGLFEFFYHLIVTVINQFAEQGAAQGSFEIDRIPMFVAHVVSRLHLGILFPEFDRVVRVAFQVNRKTITVQTGECKYFSHHPQAQSHLVKRKILGGAFFGETIFAELFDVHERMNDE